MLADNLVRNPGDAIPSFRCCAVVHMLYAADSHDQYLNRKDLEPGQYELS